MTVEEGVKLLRLIQGEELVVVGHIERFNPIVAEITKIAQRPDYVAIKRHNPTSSRITDASVIRTS